MSIFTEILLESHLRWEAVKLAREYGLLGTSADERLKMNVELQEFLEPIVNKEIKTLTDYFSHYKK